MEKIIFKHSKGVTFLILLVLVLASLGAWCFFPLRIHAELWNMKSFCNISFSVALFAFPCIYLMENVRKLKWLGLLVTFFDALIVLYLVMWTHSAVYWSPVVIYFFNHILISSVCGDGNFIEKYEDFLLAHIASVYLCGGVCSVFLWIVSLIF